MTTVWSGFSVVRGRDAGLVGPLPGKRCCRARSHVGLVVEGVGFNRCQRGFQMRRTVRRPLTTFVLQLVDVQFGKIVADEWEHESSSRSLSGRDTSFDARHQSNVQWLRAVLRRIDRAFAEGDDSCAPLSGGRLIYRRRWRFVNPRSPPKPPPPSPISRSPAAMV